MEGGDAALAKAYEAVKKAPASASVARADVRLRAPLQPPPQMRDCLCFELHLRQAFAASRQIVALGRVSITRIEPVATARLVQGNADSTPVEILLDPDQRIKRGKCLCGHFKTFSLRNGPCRHMLALRDLAMNPNPSAPAPAASWEERLRRLFNN